MDCARFRDDMLDVLYGEADPAVAARFEEHRESCSDCRDELSGFQGVRKDLQAWRADMPNRRRRYFPGVRGLAAAAAIVLAFGGGLSLARTDVSYRDGELRIVFGGGSAAQPRENTDVAQLLAQHDAAHRAEIESIKASIMQPVTPTGDAKSDAVLQRVQQMIQQSETRQRMLMQAGLTNLAGQVAAQRQADLYNISASLSALDAQTAYDVARIGTATSNMVRVNDGK
jgi:hypothetical protein